MKTVISATLIALMLVLAAPALADRDRGYYSYRGHHDYRGSHYRRDWDRHQWRGHKYDRRYHAPRYYRGGDRYIIHKHYHDDDALKWLGGAYLLNEILHHNHHYHR
ncbi:MAG: hypothetical protein WDA10_11920 [Porticoccaceae bacterium]|jgi:hypothetical protein|nr:hypothetical protein [Porticoccaceae bacterium]MEA3299276.1 hypothetical protein [Pseudomonadota bacterium]